MAGKDDREGVLAEGLSNCPGSRGFADLFGQPFVRLCLAIGYFFQGKPDGFFKFSAFREQYRLSEILYSIVKIFPELFFYQRRGRCPCGLFQTGFLKEIPRKFFSWKRR